MSRTDPLEELAAELETVAERLRSGGLDPDEAADHVQRCADLATRLGAELDERGRSAGRLEGQERLL
jgi:hypothetical protein